jgi:tetratricopeptide (TPR) repeat protein
MKRLITGLFICCSVILQAQSNAIQNALKNFDYEQAILLITKEKKSSELDFLKAKCYKNIGQYKAAIQLLEEIVRQDNSNLNAINELADCYQLNGNFRKSKFYYFMALQSSPENRFVRLNYLNSIYKLKEWNMTIALAHSILQKDSLPMLYPILGDCYNQLSKSDSASYFYKKAMKSNAEDYNTLSKLSRIYLQDNNYTELINSTDQYMKIDSSNQLINLFNGMGLCMNKNYDRAIYRLNKLFQQGDSSFLTNYYLGASYFATEDYIMAYDHLTRAFRKDSTNQNLYYYLGKSAIQSGHQQKGIQYLQNGLLHLIPKDSTLFNYYFSITTGFSRNFTHPEPEEEIKYHKLCYKYNPDYKMGLYTIGSIYDRQIKNEEEALNYYNLFLTTRSKIPTPADKKTVTASYYIVTENRIAEIKAEQEAKKKKH